MYSDGEWMREIYKNDVWEGENNRYQGFTVHQGNIGLLHSNFPPIWVRSTTGVDSICLSNQPYCVKGEEKLCRIRLRDYFSNPTFLHVHWITRAANYRTSSLVNRIHFWYQTFKPIDFFPLSKWCSFDQLDHTNISMQRC